MNQTCSKQNCNKPTINKKYQLCDEHNYERLHGVSKQQVYSERAASKPRKLYVIKTTSKPVQQTNKEKRVKQKLSEVKLNLEMNAVQSGEYYCKGCGISYPGLDKSHVLSIGQYKHLELEIRNIQLMCRSCHIDWESKNIATMIKLNCFWDNYLVIAELDQEAFRKLDTLICEYIKWQLEEKKFALNVKRSSLLKNLSYVIDLKMD